MDRQQHHYLSISDHPLFKAIGIVVTVALFAVWYYLLQYPSDLGLDSALGVICPGAMILIWEAIKRRHFWWVWLLAVLASQVVKMLFGSGSWITELGFMIYWAISFFVCIALILVCSRAKYKLWLRQQDSLVGDETIIDPVKDAFLEQLFGVEE